MLIVRPHQQRAAVPEQSLCDLERRTDSAEQRTEYAAQIMQDPVIHARDLVEYFLAVLIAHVHRPVTVEREHVAGVVPADDRCILDDRQRGSGQGAHDLPLVLRPARWQPPDGEAGLVIDPDLGLSPQPRRLVPARAGQDHEPDDLTVGADARVARRPPQPPDLIIIQLAVARSLARAHPPHAPNEWAAETIRALLVPMQRRAEDR